MFENVSIIIPFQTDYGPRAEAFEWLKRYYAAEMPEAELCLGLYNGNDINKAKAVNLAAKKATRDIFVIADADIVYDPQIILDSIHLLKKVAWVVPFTEIYDIPKYESRKLFKKTPKWPLDVELANCIKANWIYNGFAGKLNVIPRKNFEAVGGFDERFVGWGGEDDAFSHAVNTLCGHFVNYRARIFHLWHPSSHYGTNPNSEANHKLLNRYISASGNKYETVKLVKEREGYQEKMNHIIPREFNKNSLSSKSKICFAILVHENRPLVKELIDNVRYFCPNSSMVLYNGGDDPTLCDNLGVPVCPSSHKMGRGFTTIYFLETMEWLEEMKMDYDYLVNIDSDALFIREGFENFLHTQMMNTDYMAVKLRIPEEDWYIGNELMKEKSRWKQLFNIYPFYGIFNVGQVFKRSLIRSLLRKKAILKKALLETSSFGTDEFIFVNMAKELGYRIKNYPNNTDELMIRYRPHFTLDEMIHSFNNIKNSWLCHPVYRDKHDLVRKLIKHLVTEQYSKKYRSKEYPWYQSNPYMYDLSLPITSEFGNEELIVRLNSSLTHYWQGNNKNKWYKSETFADGAVGVPVFFETHSGFFAVACKLAAGGVGLWTRNNQKAGHPWLGPYRITSEDVDPIMIAQLQDLKPILICKSNDKLVYWVRDTDYRWKKGLPFNK
ncbi:galactosyltransferase-related protein [Neobacillus sp. NPDC058068]|uniref:galactosyltransferase-related protein n=1 Tax=Neobacillus sp. NPDC058068 TaxID=3346325 RepID=UPI0036DC0037